MHTLGSLFDGIGAFPLGASFFDVKTLWASEILSEAVSVNRRHFSDIDHIGDITKLSGESLPPVDIISFGSPCQDLSTANGSRLGLAGERSGLFMEVIRIIDEMREATNGQYPRYAIWENVPGCFSSNDRRDYKSVLEAFTKTEIPMPSTGKWAAAGLVRSDRANIAWCVYNAADFGLAQRRKRVFLVADFAKGSPEEILLVPKSLRWYPPQSLHKEEEVAAAVGTGTNLAESGVVASFNGGASPQAGSIAYSEKVSPTLKSASSGLRTPCVCVNDQGGDSLNVEKSDCAPTLRCSTHGNLPIVCAEAVHPKITGTLCTSAAGLSRPGGMGAETDLTVAYCLHGNMIGRDDENGHAGSGINTEVCYTLNGTDLPAVAVDCRNFKVIENISGTLQAKTTPGYSLNYQNPVHDGYIVRRLTPTECERLMGFDDSYTKYGHDGKEMSDSKRYSMLGNSIAVPCVAYIMQGIMEQYEKEEINGS